MTDYETAYRKQAGYFGEGDDPMFSHFVGEIPAGGEVLDIGVGQGRITLPLASRGFFVTGIDTSRAAIEVTRQSLAAQECSAVLWQGSFEEYQPDHQCSPLASCPSSPENRATFCVIEW